VSDLHVTLDIADIAGDFPAYRVALVVAHDLAVAAERPAKLERVIAAVEDEVAHRLQATPLAELPELQAWRAAYKAFGVRKTSYRSSVERLLKAVQQGRGLPRVNALVDAYNAVSVHHRMPIGADDLARLENPLAFRYARPGDSFVALGDPEGRDDPPKDGEVVYADAGKVLCRRWNWYQDARSATSLDTASAVLTVQSLDADPVPAAAHLADWLAEYCGGTCAWAVADAAHPAVSVAF
jgi:DNA/RNA-binding domain of Phe-tRNA-synthetase-like protein